MNAEIEYQFVDTNILVYAHDLTAGEKHQRARALVENLWETRAGCLSIQVLQEFYVTVTKKVPRPLPSDDALHILQELSTWRLHVPGADDVIAASQIEQRYQLSFWDAMIVSSAAQLGCTVLWSEDLSHGQSYGDLILVNPFVGE